MSADNGSSVKRHAFSDPLHPGRNVALLIDRTKPFYKGGAGVEHPDCDQLADVAVHLDAFYCPTCRWNGRITGGWVVDMWRADDLLGPEVGSQP